MDGIADAKVPCGGCRACCQSSQFVHIGPEETDALAHIPRSLLFPAPGRPAGHLVLGYDQNGCCPMLTDEGCSIYPHRPRACRTYDCRIFSATGVTPDQPLIADRALKWRFDRQTPPGPGRNATERALSGALDASPHSDPSSGHGACPQGPPRPTPAGPPPPNKPANHPT